MGQDRLRVGIIGAGANTRKRHIPGFRAIEGVDIVAVCNRRMESTMAASQEHAIPRTFERWQDMVADPGIDAVLVGTWPYMHCPVTLAALEAGKHVLTEARLSMNAAEAHQMLKASIKAKNQVAQVVPSPYGLRGNAVVIDRMKDGYIGELLEVHVSCLTAALADPAAPLSWRQDVTLSGFNMLQLGIFHETLLRWVPPPTRVVAQAHAFIPTRIDPASGVRRPVGTPDSVQVLSALENGARVVYHFSGVTRFGQEMTIRLFGTEGMLLYDIKADRLWGNRQSETGAFEEIPIPPEKATEWTVEADFVAAIRTGAAVRFTDFATGVAYMEFTEAAARSAQRGEAIDLPLAEYGSSEEE